MIGEGRGVCKTRLTKATWKQEFYDLKKKFGVRMFGNGGKDFDFLSSTQSARVAMNDTDSSWKRQKYNVEQTQLLVTQAIKYEKYL